MYFCAKNKNKNNKNLPTKPKRGGMPANESIINIAVIQLKLCL